MMKHIHRLARYTALILISAAPIPFDDAYAETTEQQVAAETVVSKPSANHKPKTEQDQ
ncbi:hypothetical protein [Methylovulum miyakonense]|uniref:hypothetical protein n=1 Tax=Methylovulum miyakonense TaxID=645578 RepID=UPI00037C1A85|nr:hypothetical protein [Methylovulum miyakonense]